MSFNAKDMTQGGQIIKCAFALFEQIANIIFYVLFILFWVLCGLMLMYRLSWQTFVNGCVYWWFYDAGSDARYYSFPSRYTPFSITDSRWNTPQNTSWPINILDGAVSSCGLVSPLLPWFLLLSVS
ncbi:TraD N-terminal domain-containing protein [Klebsiella pneumoniae]